MKKQVLLALLLMCTTALWAVNLPSTSYRAYQSVTDSYQGYKLGTGTTFINYSIVGTADYSACVPQTEQSEIGDCYGCCTNIICPGNEDDCWDGGEKQNLLEKCQAECQGTHLGSIDASIMLLFAMIAAYGAVAVYRRKMQQV